MSRTKRLIFRQKHVKVKTNFILANKQYRHSIRRYFKDANINQSEQRVNTKPDIFFRKANKH